MCKKVLKNILIKIVDCIMGIIRKLTQEELPGEGGGTGDLYPITHAKAVYVDDPFGSGESYTLQEIIPYIVYTTTLTKELEKKVDINNGNNLWVTYERTSGIVSSNTLSEHLKQIDIEKVSNTGDISNTKVTYSSSSGDITEKISTVITDLYSKISSKLEENSNGNLLQVSYTISENNVDTQYEDTLHAALYAISNVACEARDKAKEVDSLRYDISELRMEIENAQSEIENLKNQVSS